MQYYRAIFDNITEGKALMSREKKLFFVYFIDHTIKQVSLISADNTYDFTKDEFDNLGLYAILRENKYSMNENVLYDNMMNIMSCALSCQNTNI